MYRMWNIVVISFFTFGGVASIDDTTVDLLTPLVQFGESCGYMSCPVPTEGALNVHIVPATHAELGLSLTFDEYYSGVFEDYMPTRRNMKNVLDGVITSLWGTNRRKFTITDMPYFFHWWKNRDGTVRRMVYQLLRQGRLYFAGGGWSESDESVANYHAIIDQYTYTLRKLNATFLDCGRPLVTWQVDNYGHSREYASLVAQMGFDGHFINPISYDDELQRMRSKSLEFVWRGSDDLGAASDIYTHKLFDGYWTPPGFCFGVACSDPLIITSSHLVDNVEERVQEFTKLMLERQGPYYNTNHTIVIMGQRFGYVEAETWFANIDKLITGVNSRQRHAKVRLHLFYSTPSCYLKAVQKAQPMLKTKQDDFYPLSYNKNAVASGMFTTRPIIKYMAREMHLYLQIAKQLQLFGHLKNNDDKFETIQWITGVLHDHSILTGAISPRVREYYVQKAHRAKHLCRRIIRPALNFLRKASKANHYYMCHFNVTSCWPISSSKAFIVIYNPLPWVVTMPIRLPVRRQEYLLYDPKGELVNHSIIAIPEIVIDIPERKQMDHRPSMNDEMVFIAKDLPAMGYRSYYLQLKETRKRRSIIKKLPKNKKKKYLTRQTNNMKIDADELLDDIDYEYFEDATLKPVDMQVGNVTRNEIIEQDDDYIMTPRPRTTEAASAESTSSSKMDSETTERSETTDISQETETTTKSEKSQDSETSRESEKLKESEKAQDSEKSQETEKIQESVKLQESDKQQDLEIIEDSAKSQEVETTTKSEIAEELEKSKELEKLQELHKFDTTTPSVEPTALINADDELDNSTYSDEVEGHPTRKKGGEPGYFSEESSDRFIKNEYININLNRDYSKITSIVLSNGLTMYFEPQMFVYVSDEPVKMGTEHTPPGAFIFRPMDPKPEVVSKDPSTKVHKTEIVEEIHMQFAPYAAIAVKLYKGLPYVELDWIVGPLPIDDGFGREIFIRYVTDLNNNGVFYTDANGRQTIKRVKDSRATYRPITTDKVASNFYPVSSKVYIEDPTKNIRFSVFPDRGEGCASLENGALDIMLHRRIFTDDTGYQINLNETERTHPLIVRGKHMLYLSKADYRPNKVFEKKFAKELTLTPKIFASSHPQHVNFSYPVWKNSVNEYTALNKKLPVGVHILTIEKWYEDILIRIENYLEITDVVRNGLKKVFIDELFKDYKLYGCRETMLAANIWKDQYIKMLWTKEKFVKRFNDAYGNASQLEFVEDLMPEYEPVQITKGIEIAPQEIRTFVCRYEDLTTI